MNSYDVIVIGAGPAGITAAIYASRKKMKLLVISMDIGGQTNWTANIENYTGFRLITGADLIKRFREHLKEFEIDLKENERVKGVVRDNGSITVNTDQGSYVAKTAIISSGRIPRKLEVPGENKFIAKGIAYCATCDAPIFSGADVAVIGGGNSAIDAALQLEKYANKIYIVDAAQKYTADQVYLDKAQSSSKIFAYHGAKVKEVSGRSFVEKIKIEQAGKEIDLPVTGMFVEIGSSPSADFVPGLKKNDRGEIQVNCGCETNIDGVFAAGDVTTVPAKQIITACGQGAIAALSAYNYLMVKNK